MLELVAVAMTAVGYTLLTLLMGVLTSVPPALKPLLAYVFSHQAGGLVKIMTTYAILDGKARIDVPGRSLLPFLGFLAGPSIRPTVEHTGRRALLDSQGGYYSQALFYVLVGAGTFGWSSIWGWPIAVLGLLVTILVKPWLASTWILAGS